MTTQDPSAPTKARHLKVALGGAVFAASMFGAAYAAVPLYDWFCRVTGLGGTTQVAVAAPIQVLDQTIEVRFDLNAHGLPWTLEPPKPMTVRIGEVITANYHVTNTGETANTGTATYNVVPLITGSYFNKLQCFCFTEQTLKPGERTEMPVVFFIDPEIVKHHQASTTPTITLSYTFYPVANPTEPLASGPVAVTPPRS